MECIAACLCYVLNSQFVGGWDVVQYDRRVVQDDSWNYATGRVLWDWNHWPSPSQSTSRLSTRFYSIVDDLYEWVNKVNKWVYGVKHRFILWRRHLSRGSLIKYLCAKLSLVARELATCRLVGGCLTTEATSLYDSFWSWQKNNLMSSSHFYTVF